MKRRLFGVIMVSAVFAVSSANAAPYPGDKPVKIIAAFSAGSATDISARIVGDVLRTELGANVIVDNKAGAQGLIGTDFAVKSPPDGYTLTISSSSLNSINPGLFKKLPYDAVNDFTHIARLTTMPILLLVNAYGPYKTIQDLIAAGNSGKLNYGYGSPGGQVSAVAFNNTAKVKAVGVAYKSQSPALTDLVGGVVDYVLADLSVATTLLKAGRLRAIAISTPHRLPEWKDVPTFAETGYKDYDLVVWVGLAGPAGMPKELTQRINAAINKALARPDVKEKFQALGMQAAPNSVEDQDQFVKSQLAAWKKRMVEAKIQPE